MDKKTTIAVVAGIVVVFLVFGGQSLISQIFSSSNSSNATTDTTDASALNVNATNTMPTTEDQLQYQDVTVGTGTPAVAGDQVTVNYIGELEDGTVFDSSLAPGRTPFVFTLGAGQVIQGWDEGVAGMKVGGKRVLVIPPSLGYGDQAVGSIPANSTLIFQVDLLSVKQ